MFDSPDTSPSLRSITSRVRALIPSLFFVAVVASGCDLDWEVVAPQAALDEAGSSVSIEDADAPDVWLPDGLSVADADADADAAVEAAVDAASDGGGSCTPKTPCTGQGEICVYPDGFCGAGASGRCEPQPSGCEDASLPPACGCDVQIHASRCAAHLAGVDVSNVATCSTPLNTFRCGPLYCAKGIEYCRIGGPPAARSYECRSLGGCVLGCLCSVLTCLGGSCSESGGNVMQTCP